MSISGDELQEPEGDRQRLPLWVKVIPVLFSFVSLFYYISFPDILSVWYMIYIVGSEFQC